MQVEQSSQAENLQLELKLVKKLIRLSRICWSPTLRANVTVIESLERELQAANASRHKTK